MALETHMSASATIETGKLEDWGSMTLVESFGTVKLESGREIEVVRPLAGLGFELWDKETGFKAKVNVTEVLNAAVEKLMSRIEEQE